MTPEVVIMVRRAEVEQKGAGHCKVSLHIERMANLGHTLQLATTSHNYETRLATHKINFSSAKLLMVYINLKIGIMVYINLKIRMFVYINLKIGMFVACITPHSSP